MFVLFFYGLFLEATATYGVPISQVVSYNDGLIPALANTTPTRLAPLVIFFPVDD